VIDTPAQIEKIQAPLAPIPFNESQLLTA